MRSVLGLIATTAIIAGSASSRNNPNKLDGAWINIRDEVVAPDTSYERMGGPGLLVISGRYFSQTAVSLRFPGAHQTSLPSTSEAKAARYDALVANAGIQEVSDSLILIHVQHAKNPGIVGTTAKARYRLHADTLWLSIGRKWERDSAKIVNTTQIYVRQR